MKLGVQPAPEDYRIFNRPSNTRPISEFFEGGKINKITSPFPPPKLSLEDWCAELEQLYRNSSLRHKEEFISNLRDRAHIFKSNWANNMTPQAVIDADIDYETRH